jgi:hypothetical protein
MRPDSGSWVKLVSELQHRYDQLGQEIKKRKKLQAASFKQQAA